MKVSPLAQGTGVPAQSDSSIGKTADQGKLARAKAIAMGQEVPEAPKSSGDPQVDRINTKRIKMRTQQSTNRHEVVPDIPVNPEVVQNITPEVESPTIDTKEQVVGEEATKPIDPQVAAFIKAKRALQVKEREVAAREEALKNQTPAGNDTLIDRLKANPLSVLQEAGVTYDQLTEAILNNQSGITPEIQRLELKIKALEEGLNGQLTTRDQQAEQQVLGEIKREALALTAQGDQYEAIREAKAQQQVVELIHRTWKETGEVLDVTSAAELVENQLIEDYTPFARLKKIQSRLTPDPETKPEQQPAPQKPGTKIMRTLTNRDTASPVMDRRSRAIAAMQGTLKKG